MEHLQVMLATMVDQQEKYLNSRLSRMTKTVTFLPWSQPFNSFCFEILFYSFFFFPHKMRGHGPPANPWCRQTLYKYPHLF